MNPFSQIRELDEEIVRLKAHICHQDSLISELKQALLKMIKPYKSVSYAQWPAEVHLANELLEKSK